MRDKILKFTSKITAWHEAAFTYLTLKSKKSIWFTLLLLFLAIYEVFEHFVIPAYLAWYVLK